MKITETLNYAADPATVFAMLTDEAFQERKCIEAGALRHESAVSRNGDSARIVTQRDLPTDRLPDFAKSLVGTRLAVTETYDWGGAGADGGRTGRLVVEVAGAPVALRASVALTPVGSGTTMTVEGDLKASIPLLGSKVERAAAPAVIDAIRGEGRSGVRWLTERA